MSHASSGTWTAAIGECVRRARVIRHALLCSAAVHHHPTVFRIRAVLAGLCLAVSGAALAHDTWLHVAEQQPGSGLLVLQMGSGARYPRSEGPVPGSRVVGPGCADETGAGRALAPRQELPLMLELRARVGGAKAVACWLELPPVNLVLTPELVQVYLQDIRAPQAVRDAWAAQQKAGIAWKEAYRKFVRIETPLPGADAVAASPEMRKPRNYPLELLPVGTDPVRARTEAGFQALADGKPVPGLAVEFVSLRSPAGIWRVTDSQGRLHLALPFGGEWLVRSTVLKVPASPQEPWRSAFATLTVQVR